MTQAITDAFAALQAHGLRLTAARRAIITTLASLSQPATIQALAEQTTVDTATVYRNISPLLAAGLIEEISMAGGLSRYALAHGHHHDHIICTTCGRIVHVPCELHAASPIMHPQFANIDHHAVTYYGTCKNCSHSL